MIERFTATTRRVDEDFQLNAGFFLAHVFVQQLGTQGTLQGLLLRAFGIRGDQAIGFYHGRFFQYACVAAHTNALTQACITVILTGILKLV